MGRQLEKRARAALMCCVLAPHPTQHDRVVQTFQLLFIIIIIIIIASPQIYTIVQDLPMSN